MPEVRGPAFPDHAVVPDDPEGTGVDVAIAGLTEWRGGPKRGEAHASALTRPVNTQRAELSGEVSAKAVAFVAGRSPCGDSGETTRPPVTDAIRLTVHPLGVARGQRPDIVGGNMIIGTGNYEVAFTDVDGRPKKVILYLGEEHIDILQSSSFRVIAGWEKKMGNNVTKVICLSENHMATLELTN